MNETKETVGGVEEVGPGMQNISSSGQNFPIMWVGAIVIFVFAVIYGILSFRKKVETVTPSKVNGFSSFVMGIVSVIIFFYMLNIGKDAGLAGGVVVVMYFPLILAMSILSIIFGIKSLKKEVDIPKIFGIIGLILGVAPILYVLVISVGILPIFFR